MKENETVEFYKEKQKKRISITSQEKEKDLSAFDLVK